MLNMGLVLTMLRVRLVEKGLGVLGGWSCAPSVLSMLSVRLVEKGLDVVRPQEGFTCRSTSQRLSRKHDGRCAETSTLETAVPLQVTSMGNPASTRTLLAHVEA